MDSDSGALVSGEGVRLALTQAGVGSRTIAAAIDVAIQFLALLVLVIADVGLIASSDDAAAAAAVLVEAVLVLAGYPIVAEWTTRGRTVGKLCMGLRVVRDDGGPIGFRQALVRGLAGLVLDKPGLLFPLTTIAGVVTISVSRQEKRIGDMLAGTIVLNERPAGQSARTPQAWPARQGWVATQWVPPWLAPWAVSLDLHRLDDQLALRLRQFVTRAHALTPAAQYALGEDLRARVLATTSPPPPDGTPTPLVLTGVLAERRRRADAAPANRRPAQPHVRAAQPPVRPGPAPLAPPPAEPSQWARPADPADAVPPADPPFAPPR